MKLMEHNIKENISAVIRIRSWLSGCMAGKSAKISCEVSLESVCRNICRADDRTLLMDVTAPAKVAIKDCISVSARQAK